MKAETLSAELSTALVEVAWGQWSQLGVSGAAPREHERRAADPEALLLFTLEVARAAPRLFDEVLDWLALNESLISVHRLRGLCADPTDRMLVDGALDWAAGVRRRKPPTAWPAGSDAVEMQLLFPAFPTPRGGRDPAFARHGLARELVTASGKSQPPRLATPIAFAFRLRRLLGVSVRAEVIRVMLTSDYPRLPPRMIAASAGYEPRNVKEGLVALDDAGVIDVVHFGNEPYYGIDTQRWAALLELEDLPLHHDWIPTYRALTRITRWLQQPGLDDLSPYLRASRARTLVETSAHDLALADVAVDPTAAPGAAFWDMFVELTRNAVRAAAGTGDEATAVSNASQTAPNG